MKSEDLDERIARCLEGALSTAERAELLAELERSPEAARRFADAYEIAALTDAALADPKALVNAIRREANQSSHSRGSKRFASNVLQRVQHDRLNNWRRQLTWGVGVAAILLLMVLLFRPKAKTPPTESVTPSETQTLAALQTISGDAFIERDKRRLSARETQALQPGDRLLLGADAKMQIDYPDNTRLDLSAGTVLQLGEVGQSAGDAKRIVLEEGRLTATVTPQPEGRPLVIASANATTEVLGTSFSISADERSTRLEVSTGKVRFTRRDGGPSVVVGGSEYSVAQANTPLEVVRISANALTTPLTRNAALWPFSSYSPWNHPMGTGARFAAAVAGSFDLSKGAVINCHEYSHPVFIMRPDDPVRDIYVLKEAKPRMKLRVPADAKPDPSQWGTMHLIDPELMRIYETTEAKRLPNGDLNVHEFMPSDITGDGFFGRDHTSRITGVLGIGGLIRKGELSGGIRHAVALSVVSAAISRTPEGKNFVWPVPEVSMPIGNNSGGNIHFGTLLAIPPGVDVAELAGGNSGPVFEMARALQHYGAYVVESFGAGRFSVGLFAEPAAEAEIPAGFDKRLGPVLAKLQVVTNNGPQSIGGGGTPRCPFAPPLRKRTKEESAERQF